MPAKRPKRRTAKHSGRGLHALARLAQILILSAACVVSFGHAAAQEVTTPPAETAATLDEVPVEATASEASEENPPAPAADVDDSPVPSTDGPVEAVGGLEEGPSEPPLEPEGLEAVNTFYRERVGAENAEATEVQPPEADPERAQGFSAVLQAFAALCVLCGIIILLGYLARTLGKRTPLLAGQRYGTVLGRVSLTPRASLHFVRSADRVLVLGVTQQSITLVSEFPQDAFAQAMEDETESPEPADFLGELRRATSSTKPEPDEELTALRGDLQRLQRYLKQHASGPDA